MLTTLAFFPTLGPGEIIVILAVALIFFGRRLPEVGRSLGKGIVEFRKGVSGLEEDLHQATSPSTSTTPSSTSSAAPQDPAKTATASNDGEANSS